jgi:hypothetical protein
MIPVSGLSAAGSDRAEPASINRGAAPEIDINGTVEVDCEEWEIQQNITISKNSVLIINNTHMKMNTWSRALSIFVLPGGELILKNSLIEPINNVFGYHIYIYGNLTLINSTISYCGQRSPFVDIKGTVEGIVMVNGFATIENSTIDYNSIFQVWSSNVDIKNSIITNCSTGIELFNSTFKAERCGFINNYEDIKLQYLAEFEISDSIFDSLSLYTLLPEIEYYGIHNPYGNPGSYSGSGLIENCTFQGKNQAISFNGGRNTIQNSTFYYNVNNVMQMGGILNVSGCSFDHPNDPFDINLVAYENNYGVLAYWFTEEVNIDNCTFNHMASSIILEYSGINRINDCIFTNSGKGVEMMSGIFEGNNLTAENCEIGIQFVNSQCNLTNSRLTSNTIGIQLEWAQVILRDNEIAKNTAWGIVQQGFCWDYVQEAIIECINFSGYNFPDPTDGSYAENKNGIGNLATLRELKLHVTGSQRDYIGSVDVKLENDLIEQYNKDGVIYMVEETKTDYSGNCQLGMLIDHVIIDGYEKTYCESYKLTASIQLTDDIVIKNETYIETGKLWSQLQTIYLELPDLSLSDSGFILSNAAVIPGEILKANTTLYYTGPEDLELPPINVSMYVDGVLVDSVQLDNLSGPYNDLDIELEWKAETGGVPMPNGVEDRQVKIIIEMPDGLEYDRGSYNPERDNSVTRRILILNEEGDDPWHISGSTPLASATFFGAIVLGVLIIILLIRYIIIRGRRKGEEPPEQQVPEGRSAEVPKRRGPHGHSDAVTQRRVPLGRRVRELESQRVGESEGRRARGSESQRIEGQREEGRKKVFE